MQYLRLLDITRRNALTGAFLCTLLALLSPLSTAQGQDKPKEIPPAEVITLETKDFVQLKCTYYGSLQGKAAVPVVFLHDADGNRGVYHPFAMALQKIGYACLTVDLRGHGDSTQRIPGAPELAKPKSFRREDWAAILYQDLVAVSKFLRERNDAGEFNAEATCVVAAGMSTPYAIEWAVQDWEYRDLPGRRYSKNIKALVLLSPTRRFESLNIARTLDNPILNNLSFLLVVGKEDRTAFSEASRIESTLERGRPKVEDPAKVQTDKTVFLTAPETDLQGAKLLDPRFRLGVDRQIATFMQWRLIDRMSEHYPWSARITAGN